MSNPPIPCFWLSGLAAIGPRAIAVLSASMLSPAGGPGDLSVAAGRTDTGESSVPGAGKRFPRCNYALSESLRAAAALKVHAFLAAI